MTTPPPGRSGRTWLRDRLAIARRGADVLEQKVHALVREQRRLAHHHRQTARAWHEAMDEAERWMQRALVIGGTHQVALAAAALPSRADADVVWRSTMGATHPARVDLHAPEPDVLRDIGATSALHEAAVAFGRAARAGLEHAAATRALEVVETELVVSRRRLRALDHRLAPALAATLRRVELALDEEEREDMVRAAWAAARTDEGAFR
jgi:V/A-type H+-transporting ATPase subunit D